MKTVPCLKTRDVRALLPPAARDSQHPHRTQAALRRSSGRDRLLIEVAHDGAIDRARGGQRSGVHGIHGVLR